MVDLSNVEADGARHSKFAESAELLEIAQEGIEDEETSLLSPGRNTFGEHAGALIISLGQGVAELSR